MSNHKKQPPSIFTFGIDFPPLDSDQLKTLHTSLKEKHFTYLIGVITLVVLAAMFTMKVISLDFEQDRELLHLSLYIGAGIGLFSGITIRGDILMKLRVSVIGIIACTAAGLGSSMLVTLFVGYAPNWISSINILAGALASMWLLIYYDETVKALSSMKFVNANQLDFIIKASNHFDSLMGYAKSIHKTGRKPVMGEYWVIREWVSDNAKSS